MTTLLVASLLHDAREAARTIACPPLVLRGEDAALFGHRHALDVTNALPNATLETIAETGHDPTLERPLEAVAHVLRFLSRSQT